MQNNEKIKLLDLNIDEMKKVCEQFNQKPFRAKQLFSWLHKGVCFDDMSNIPKDFLQKLNQQYVEGYPDIIQKQVSKDGTVKYLFGLHDGQTCETVLMKQKYGNTLCISTQVGCKMKCDFCVSGMCGFTRNMPAGEILSQVIAVIKDGNSIKNIVLMGMGEPFDNYDHVVKFLKLVNDKDGLNVGLRNISLSTCGIVPKIIEFSKEKLPVTLAISLHASNDQVRQRIMPIAKQYNIHEVVDAAKFYFNNTGRRVIIEYVMLRDVNILKEHAKELSKLLKGFNCHVNLIAFNSGNGPYQKPSKIEIEAFMKILENNRISVTIRKTSGDDIDAACGQLRKRNLNE